MPHISSKKLKKKAFYRINAQLIDTFSELSSSNKMERFLGELLTDTERLMLAKRLALIFMLERGYSFKTIERTLKVSEMTVMRFWKKMKQNSFAAIISQMKSKKAGKNLDMKLDKILKELLPPPYYGRRWR